MMDRISSYLIICVVCFPSLVEGTVTVSFDPVKTPLTNSVDITCTLTGSSTYAVTWSFASTTTSCGSGLCSPDPSPHTYSMSGNVYTLTLPSAAIANCISYSCADAADSADTISEDLFVSYFDKADIVPTEPGANSDGTISVTTGCVLSPSDLTITWSLIQGGVDVTFTPDYPINTSDRSTCTRTCHSEEDEKVTNGFYHTEYTGHDFVVVQYQVNVSHKSYPDAADHYTWTSASYKIKAALVSGEVVLSPSSPVTTENNSLTLTCTYSGAETVTSLTWKRVKTNESDFANLGLINAECNAIILPIDSNLYEYDCPSSKQYTWTIKKVTRQNEGDKYKCDVDTPSPGVITSNYVIIAIQVPITSVEMIAPVNSIITVKENTETELKCKTSGGLPEATVTWYKNGGTSSQQGNEVVIDSLITSSSVTINGLKEVTSILKYSQSRNENGWRIYCKARNVVGQALIVSTRKPQLNVQYAPDSLEIKGFVDSGEYRVIEKSQGQLSCTITGGNPKPTLLWDCYNSGTNIASNEGIVTRNQTWLAKREKDKTCLCRSFHYSGNRSVSVFIKTLYPPNEPTFQIHGTSVSGTIKVIRNNALSVSCNSSANPPPSYTWTYSNNLKRSGQVLSITNVQSNKRYTCLVQNTMNPTDGQKVTRSNSSYIDVKMLYAPAIPTFNYWNASGQLIPTRSLDVIKDDTFKVVCTSDGEPSPAYYWDNHGNNRILTITRIDTDKTSSVCKATNTMKETVGQTSIKYATASLIINVQYPPSAVTLQYGKGDILTTALKVREGTPFNISCSSRSNPPPSYNWTGTVSSASAVLNVNKAMKTHAGTITCNVANVMIRTFANPEKQKTVATNKVLDLQILYPPKIGDLRNFSVVEDSQLNVSCPVTTGIPQQTTYEWLRKGQVWKTTKRFTIDKVNRNDAMFYTCKVTNTMEATGEKPVSSDVTKAFYLNVWYSATVNSFFISGHEGESKVVKNESDRVEFTCTVDSNPGSDMSVTYTEEVLETATNVKHLTHVIDSASCTARGEYKCTGFNQYNQNHVYQIINLYINCSPRPSPFTTLRGNVRSAQHIPAVLTFTTLAYPETNLEFQWYTWYNNVRHPVTNSEEFQIDTLNLQSNLTIKYVNRTYYGKYELQVKNTIGYYIQFFYLDPEDKPETPRGFQHLSGELTESSLTVQWIPGSDNGPRQTFVMRYKKSLDKDWTDIEIADSGEDLMNYTLTSLSSGTQYECVLYARNILGNSSQTNVLRIRTEKSSLCETTSSVNESTSAIIVGCVLGIVIILLSVYAGYITLLLKRTKGDKEQSELHLTSSAGKSVPVYANLSHSAMESRQHECTEMSNAEFPSSSIDTNEYMSLGDKLRENKETYDVISVKH